MSSQREAGAIVMAGQANIVEKLVGMEIAGVRVGADVVVLEFSDAVFTAFDTFSWTSSDDDDRSAGHDANHSVMVTSVESTERFLTIRLDDGSRVTIGISSDRLTEAAVLKIAGIIVVFRTE